MRLAWPGATVIKLEFILLICCGNYKLRSKHKMKGIAKEEAVGFLKEFRDFASKGNAIDMAVGIIIGGAFGKIVSSLVNDVIMPPVGRLLGAVDFRNLF